MSIHVALTHVTRYRFDRAVSLSPHVVRLRPAPHTRSRVLSYSLRVEPEQHFINWQQDAFANYLARVAFPGRATELVITVDLVVEMAVYNPFDFFLEPQAEHVPFAYDAALRTDLAPYLAHDPLTPRLEALLDSVDRSRRRTVDFLVDINQRLHRDVRYLIRLEPGVQTPEQTLERGSGSCRDSAWLLVQMLRHLGLAARFVSGYLIQLTADVKPLDGPAGAERDFTDLHAWCEVYLPGAGWIGLDPTSGLFAGEGHIPLACTPQPAGAAPVEGLVDACDVEFEHDMRVTRLRESPRVTLPYRDEQWEQVLRLGDEVDARMRAGGVRLTQGGEPTFVATSDRDAAEWNTDAAGPTKRGYAAELIGRLAARYGPGGFLHFGQGKWYPGEQLPRWALTAAWRRDGQPCWHDPGLFADERAGGSATAEDARAFMSALVETLGVEPRHVCAGHEDTWYYLWRERRLPVNVDPFDSRVDDELERARLRKVFGQGLGKIVGYALPLRRAAGVPALRGARWVSGPWFLRDGTMYLIPGDSAMGWRLPLDSLPWARESERQSDVPPDPFVASAPLAPAIRLRAQYARSPARREDAADASIGDRAMGEPSEAGSRPSAEAPPGRFNSAGSTVRTALCVEERGGVVYVFMPPLASADDYLDLLAAVEGTARQLGARIVLEGYPPPRDPRLEQLQVTPDPGVIEVNIHPAHDWAQLVDHTEFLYQAAFETRLGAEKFQLDGRHTGTGGGNHVVLGGATPADSPFLRRPDLLASLIAYWHNHPSLSYLFSGLFLGPSSQAPRIDEARDDQVYELEIALAELRAGRAAHDREVPPWMVDRGLRNLLIDVTGNTHRAEFCIDKLYSPDSATGRLGLLELRALEMPPHARMSIVQQLLLRTLVARFWEQPYAARLQRWGTALHDRFLLPAFIAMDFEDVLHEIRQCGFGFDDAWFAPHFAFRFPLLGDHAVRGVRLELRMALEPWHVMGEEGAAGGTVRYVDSSLERIEVKVSGLADSRYVLTVNGNALPLQPTGRTGEFVCGVRYRAWLPPSALHPSIGVHAPLTVDVVDDWMQRSLGGCQYFVAHPGGRNYQTFPVNAYEAESRRLARFCRMGHTPGRMRVEPARPSSEFPFTLDLRRV